MTQEQKVVVDKLSPLDQQRQQAHTTPYTSTYG